MIFVRRCRLSRDAIFIPLVALKRWFCYTTVWQTSAALTTRRTGKEMDVMDMTTIDDATRTELEAAAFRRLVAHLRERTDVQNIDLMNLAGFCRNCLSRWYREEAAERGIEIADPAAREIVYGMPYKEWQALHQKGASPAQQAAFAAAAKSGH
jgi:hypothetical protein